MEIIDAMRERDALIDGGAPAWQVYDAMASVDLLMDRDAEQFRIPS